MPRGDAVALLQLQSENNSEDGGGMDVRKVGILPHQISRFQTKRMKEIAVYMQ
jgi:hypothetical protein